jgi:hypothetical protein
MSADTEADTGTEAADGAVQPQVAAEPAARERQRRGAALELLVHGVGGTTPADMLGDPRVVRVTGDDVAGTYRRADERDSRAEVVQEAYSWANLTSGSGSRAFWLLLLPFMVVNLAHWMRPARMGRAAAEVYALLVRLAGLGLTVLLVGAAGEVALDLTGWQCAGNRWCTSGKSWLGWLSAAHGGWWSEPGRRLAVCAAVPVAVVGVLWFLSHRTWAAYEAARMPGGRGEWEPAGEMQRPGFWLGRRAVRRLRLAHAAAGLLTVAVEVAVPALSFDARALGGAVPSAVGWVLIAVLAVLGAGVLAAVAGAWRSRGERGLDEGRESPLVSALPWVALAAVLGCAVYAGWSRPGWVSAGALPGSSAAMTGMCAAQLALVAAVLAVSLPACARGARAAADAGPGRDGTAVPAPPVAPAPPVVPSGRRSAEDAAAVPPAAGGADGSGAAEPAGGSGDSGPERVEVPGPGMRVPGGDEGFGGSDRVAFGGIGGAVTMMLAGGVGTLFTAAVSIWVADALDRGATPGAPGGHIAGPPTLLSWHDAGLPAGMLLLAAVLLVPVVLTLRRGGALRAQVERAYRVPPGTAEPRTREIASALSRARLTEAGPLLLGTLAVVAFALGAGAIAGAEASRRIPSQAAEHAPLFLSYAVTTAEALGSWLAGATAVALFWVGRTAYSKVGARRTIGVLWDIGTFWPRAAHPFAPPCYAERAVPDLVWRISSWLAEDPARRLVLSAHSQGTVLAAAAVWQLDPGTRRRVALLTYGSPLRRLYGRYFPAYFGPEELAWLHQDAPAWRNLFRVTDPIGGPVRVAVPAGRQPVDAEPFVDPLVFDRDLDGHPLPVPINAHSQYQADPRFDEERARILREV